MMIIRMFNEVDYESDEAFDEEEKEKNLDSKDSKETIFVIDIWISVMIMTWYSNVLESTLNDSKESSLRVLSRISGAMYLRVPTLEQKMILISVGFD